MVAFFAGLLLGPFGIIIALYMGGEAQRETLLVENGLRKQCRQCFELVRPQARVCKHCGNDLMALDLGAK